MNKLPTLTSFVRLYGGSQVNSIEFWLNFVAKICWGLNWGSTNCGVEFNLKLFYQCIEQGQLVYFRHIWTQLRFGIHKGNTIEGSLFPRQNSTIKMEYDKLLKKLTWMPFNSRTFEILSSSSPICSYLI